MRIEYRINEKDLEGLFDLIIIGGGINGAGLARDAAERGLKTLLIEKNDFGSGCSANSTRLIHGGLRYLEYLEFSLVYESLQEREVLLQNYPHLVNPLGLLVPAYKKNKYNLNMLKMGMLLYDWLSAGKSLLPHQVVKKEQFSSLDLNINKKDLEGAVFYHDAQVPFVERLILENILTAQEQGATCLNHCELTEIHCSKMQDKYHAKSVKFKDLLNGKKPYTVYGKNIINMTGPWLDEDHDWLETNEGFKLAHNPKPRIGGTKGSHIVVKPFPGAPAKFGIYNEAKSDGRPFFILPFKIGMNGDLYLIGTTDIFLEANEKLDQIKISEKEINYLINEVNTLFPEANLSRKTITKTFCGVRPLPRSNTSKAGKVSRKHKIINHSKEGIANYYSVVGGKITSFRSLAEEAANKFSKAKCFTAERKTIGCRYPQNMSFYDYVQNLLADYSSRYQMEAHTILHLLMLYGTNTEMVLDLCLENPQLKNKISPEFEDIEAQIVYALRHESAYTLEDILKRRLTIGLSSDTIDSATIQTISYHISQEFELVARERDKAIKKVLTTGY